ncbi:hypothetical protein [Aquimonas sp.]|jgi:hypothetical protein|uniref:DUF7079 family protein n=1 Tax=Aquimonas sp. TaxID=1872588 RepID=UPI0037C129A6
MSPPSTDLIHGIDELHPHAIVWEVLAQSWVDTEYAPEVLDLFAARLHATGLSLKSLDRIVLDEVCGAFALYSLGAIASAGMGLSPWFFPEDEARQRVQGWLDRPRWRSWLNPPWWLGLWTARGLVRGDWLELRARLLNLRSDSAGTQRHVHAANCD